MPNEKGLTSKCLILLLNNFLQLGISFAMCNASQNIKTKEMRMGQVNTLFRERLGLRALGVVMAALLINLSSAQAEDIEALAELKRNELQTKISELHERGEISYDEAVESFMEVSSLSSKTLASNNTRFYLCGGAGFALIAMAESHRCLNLGKYPNIQIGNILIFDEDGDHIETDNGFGIDGGFKVNASIVVYHGNGSPEGKYSGIQIGFTNVIGAEMVFMDRQYNMDGQYDRATIGSAGAMFGWLLELGVANLNVVEISK
ncbi:hypothetical protein MRY82_07570 [bacterium]|nr:hypothetical protein [bacterium]